ncbi:hypothetical protein AB9K26_03570 [Psychroserpens sp. XS_ASV72]|uniref:hypothetical protein n=1 Tax=Psychroserpens sp. XS_ASV72 TaxID=3241293 RepID=UPI00351980D1
MRHLYTFLSFSLSLLLITSCAYDKDDNLSLNNNPNPEATEIIAADSDLFKNLKDITTDETRPDQSIVCIDFYYPLTIFVFNNNLDYVSTNSIPNDAEFSNLLESLDESYSISVSFPITSTLATGEEFTIENKEELKDAIDLCLNEELIEECYQLIENCVWKVGYSYNYENSFLGGFFNGTNGNTSFHFEESNFEGSWTVFTIENELHLNINLIDDTGTDDDSEILDFFNYDWKVTYVDENSLLLRSEERELVLNQRCDPEFSVCTDFVFEVCETEIGSGVSEFILNDYTACIFDTLELESTLELTYHLTAEDAILGLNALDGAEIYENTDPGQTIYVQIYDQENETQYIVLITLSSIAC